MKGDGEEKVKEERKRVDEEESKGEERNASVGQNVVQRDEKAGNLIVEALVPKRLRAIFASLKRFKKRIREVLVGVALICLVYSLYSKGIFSALIKTRLVRLVLKLLFNYQPTATK